MEGGVIIANETDQEMKEVPDNGVETESSIVELEINKSPVAYHSVDTNSDTGNGKNKSTSTDKIFAGFQSGDRMSLQSISECNIGISPETIELSSDGGKSEKPQASEEKVDRQKVHRKMGKKTMTLKRIIQQRKVKRRWKSDRNDR